MFSKRLLVALAAFHGIFAAPTFSNSTVDRANLTVALVRTPPPNWPLPLTNYDFTGVTFNISEVVDAGIKLINDAKSAGSDLIVFPELWFPGFPKGSSSSHYNFTRDHLPSYIDNAIVVGDAQWSRLIAAVQEAGIFANINFAERDGDFMYMSQSLLGPEGDVLHHRRKLRPSGAERYMFSDGTTDGLKVVQTDYGRWGMLECGEHLYPSMTFNMYVQREHVHLAPFPYLAGVDDDTSLWWENEWINTGTVAVYSVLSGAYSLTPSVGASFVTDPLGNRVAYVAANVSFEEVPILYYSFNTTSFNNSVTYDINGQASWGTLSQMVDSFPEYVPKVEGEFVKHKTNSIAWLKTGELVIPEGA
ncbi:Cyanide hydratase [Colletotrichum gloeosporioides]|uniref:Cyanide hydratase n=1 Tax=Colletotrichum gloeosporioides TaxID=474922 RepID=A0A8H4CAH6_COLGL|nr:Cyanide hydratase [Colletotrichum gloeosporioides]KAF3800067.1 Cyanide hydratase [Colletotrichum gloeosporioides]